MFEIAIVSVMKYALTNSFCSSVEHTVLFFLVKDLRLYGINIFIMDRNIYK